jgi:hypothetical protein
MIGRTRAQRIILNLALVAEAIILTGLALAMTGALHLPG